MKNKFDSLKKQIRYNKYYYSKVHGLKNLTMKYFEIAQGYRYDFDNPKTYNEKINTRKLDKNPLFTKCADKIRVREYVKNKVGDKYLTKLIFTTKKMTEELYDKMPKSCVLKTASGSGTIIIIRDKDKENKKEVIDLINSYLNVDFAYIYGEMFYKKIPKEILCEELLLDENGDIPKDYKIHCFNNGGKKKMFVQVDFDRFSDHKRNIYDENFKYIDMQITFFENYKGKVEKPKNYKEMLEVAKKLSEDFDYVRVDLYNLNGKIYFGELTFTHGAAQERFYPKEKDLEWGSYWK